MHNSESQSQQIIQKKLLKQESEEVRLFREFQSNKGSLFKNESIRQPIQKYKLRIIKESLSTKQSSSIEGECQRCFELTSSLDLTFSIKGNVSCSFISKQKFNHPSPEAVIIYAIVYNHLHLQMETQKWNLMSLFSQEIIEIIKAVIIELESDIVQKQGEEFFSGIEFVQLLHRSSGTVSQRQSKIRVMLEKLSLESIQIIFKKLIDTQQISHGVQQKIRVLEAREREQTREPLISESINFLREFSKHFNVRIVVYDSGHRRSFGSKQSLMEISVKKSTSSGKFILKSLVCQEEHS